MQEAAIVLPTYVSQVLEMLGRQGFEAWCVGGCVRDSFLGLAPGDWDVTTNALPEEILRCFSGFRCIETGIRHGTVTVLLDERPVEITTYRSDGVYLDHRHPEKVDFSRRLEDDLSRRDFTINAMAYHPAWGVVDKFDGLADLHRETLRCVGEADRRFTEDALRILRCLRFASRLGFSLDPDTAEALRRKKGLLREISHERIKIELEKLLSGDGAEKVLREYSDIIFTVLPELAPMNGCAQETPYHCYDVWEHTLHAVGSIAADPVLRWAALFHDSGKPAVKTVSADGVAHFYGHGKKSMEVAETCCNRLRFSNKDREAVCTLIAYHGEVLPISEKRMKRLLGQLGEEQLFRLLELLKADVSAQAPTLLTERLEFLKEAETLAKEILCAGKCLTLRDLVINGNDLRKLGVPEGPIIGSILKTLLEHVLAGELPNEKELLEQEAKRIFQ